MAQRTKPRITITVDPDMLEEVDSYIQEHVGTDRSQIVGEALRCWYAHVLHEALMRQHAAPKSPEELEERAAWKRIRAAQILRMERIALRIASTKASRRARRAGASARCTPASSYEAVMLARASGAS